MKTLVLPLKKKWFSMIQSGVKLEEYREISRYWCNRFVKEHKPDFISHISVDLFRKYDEVCFTLGYPKSTDNERRIIKKNAVIKLGYGKPEWGAVEGKLYFVITWEKE